MNRDDLRQLTGRTEPHRLDLDAVAAIQEALLGASGLTARRSTFGRREVLQAWAERLQEGADVEVVERLADELLADPNAVVLARDTRELTSSDVIRRGDGAVVPAAVEERRYSSADLLARERDILAAAEAGRSAGLAQGPALDGRERTERPADAPHRAGSDGQHAVD